MTDTRTGITAEDRNRLRAPFASSAIKWLPIAGIINGKQQFMPHVNASLVFERLADVDPAWTLDRVEPEAGTADDPMGLKFGAPHRAWITVLGVTRSGRGGVAVGTQVDDKLLKAIESDAIKRAALAFEVGAYLRAFDTVFLPANVGGQETFRTKKGKDRNGREVDKFSYLTANGKAQLAGNYERVLAHKRFAERYGAPVEYGDVAALEGEGSLADAEAASAAEQVEPELDTAQVDVLILLSKFNGRDTPEDVVRETLSKHSFVKCLAKVLTGVGANLLLPASAIDELRDLAVAASEEDADALRELGDRLVAAQKASGEGEGQEAMPV